MSSTNPIFQGHLSETLALLRFIEREFRSRSSSEDDDEVKSILLQQADLSAAEADKLLDMEPGLTSEGHSPDWLLKLPVVVARPPVIEEQTMLNLSFAFTVLSAKRASFHVMRSLADEPSMQAWVNESLQGAAEAAKSVFHLLPTRSKIAFNMLTPNEIDPSVDTKASDARVV